MQDSSGVNSLIEISFKSFLHVFEFPHFSQPYSNSYKSPNAFFLAFVNIAFLSPANNSLALILLSKTSDSMTLSIATPAFCKPGETKRSSSFAVIYLTSSFSTP